MHIWFQSQQWVDYYCILCITDDEDSGEDEDIVSRNNIKRQAQQLVDSKTRRKAGRKKKTKK